MVAGLASEEAALDEHWNDIAVEDLKLASVAPDFGFASAVGTADFVFGVVAAQVVTVVEIDRCGFVRAVGAAEFVFGAVAAYVVAVAPDYGFVLAVGDLDCIFDRLY